MRKGLIQSLFILVRRLHQTVYTCTSHNKNNFFGSDIHSIKNLVSVHLVCTLASPLLIEKIMRQHLVLDLKQRREKYLKSNSLHYETRDRLHIKSRYNIGKNKTKNHKNMRTMQANQRP